MDLSKLIHGFLQVVSWICQIWYIWIPLSCNMDLLELLHGFVKVVLSISRPLPKKTKLKFDQDFKANWTVCFELNVLNGLILLDALDQLGLLQFFDHKLQSKHSHAQMCLNIKGLFIAAILHSIQCILYSVYYTLSSFKALNREIKPVSEYKRSGY